MAKRGVGRFFWGLLLTLAVGLPAGAQMTEEQIAGRAEDERFLLESEVAEAEKMPASEGVTEPYKLTLTLGDRTEHALWKNPQGRVRGFVEGWKYEIAAYELDKYLGTNMVPPTVMKRHQGSQGSCQLWMAVKMDMDQMTQQGINPEGAAVGSFNNAIFLQRAFDNLIANEDRHLRNILITDDWRMLLIDHSRSFRFSKKHQSRLIFTEKHPEGDKRMKRLPRAFVEKIRELDADKMNELTAEWLTEAEIEAVLARRDLILEEVQKLIDEFGEDKTLY